MSLNETKDLAEVLFWLIFATLFYNNFSAYPE